MHIGPFDYIFLGCLAVSAIYLAADTGVKQSNPKSSLGQKLPPRMRTQKWGYLPLVLMVVAGIILVIKVAGILPETTQSQITKWPNPYSPTSIIGKTYRNEKVTLDGYSYSNCEFYNVTFVYNGTTPIQFSSNKIFGQMIFSSTNQSVQGAWMMAAGFDALKSEVQLINLPASSILERGKNVSNPK